MTTRHRSPRPGTHLAPIPALRVIETLPELLEEHVRLTRAGYTLKETVRPYYTKSRLTMFRFVWRRRKGNTKSTYTVVWRVSMEFSELELV